MPAVQMQAPANLRCHRVQPDGVLLPGRQKRADGHDAPADVLSGLPWWLSYPDVLGVQREMPEDAGAVSEGLG